MQARRLRSSAGGRPRPHGISCRVARTSRRWQPWSTIDPYSEEVYQRLIALHRRLGRDDAARRAYRALARQLEDLGEEPDSETVELLALDRVLSDRTSDLDTHTGEDGGEGYAARAVRMGSPHRR